MERVHVSLINNKADEVIYPSNARLSRSAYFSLPGHTYFFKILFIFHGNMKCFLKNETYQL